MTKKKRRKPVEYPDDPKVLAQAIFKAADAQRDRKIAAKNSQNRKS
jgi:hypothetical protein